MMLKKIAAASLLALVLIFSSALAQDRQYAKDIIAKLASPQLHGRGYIKKGDSKAAHFKRIDWNHLGKIIISITICP